MHTHCQAHFCRPHFRLHECPGLQATEALNKCRKWERAFERQQGDAPTAQVKAALAHLQLEQVRHIVTQREGHLVCGR